ncbi:TPA: hypothetical protein EYN09_17835 [Candidatus Poribacteria bacterium]|nr:hypothetical protein [Candidatus Poribacteria bacterium]
MTDSLLLKPPCQWLAASTFPQPYGNYNSVYKRFSLWCKKGVFDCMLQYFTDDPDMECLSLDTTVSQTHHALPVPQKSVEDRPIKRSDQAKERGFTPKCHG